MPRFLFWLSTLGLLTWCVQYSTTGRLSIETLLISVCGLMKRGIWNCFFDRWWWRCVVWGGGTTHLVIFMNQADAHECVHTGYTGTWVLILEYDAGDDDERNNRHTWPRQTLARLLVVVLVFKWQKSAYEDVDLCYRFSSSEDFIFSFIRGCVWLFRGNGQLWVFLLAVLYVGRFQVL